MSNYINTKDLPYDFTEEVIASINDVFKKHQPIGRQLTHADFLTLCKNIHGDFAQLADENEDIKHALRLGKGVAKKYYQEIAILKLFLEKCSRYNDFDVILSDDSTPYDAQLIKNNKKEYF